MKGAGIFGLGRVGKAPTQRAKAMKMRISYRQGQPGEVLYLFRPQLLAMAYDADFLAITAAGGEGTRKLVTRPVLEALGPDGILINNLLTNRL
jgi:hydroxypyruvate reductase